MSTGALSRLFRSSHRAQRMTANPGTKYCVDYNKADLVVFVEERIVRHASVCEVEL